MSIDVVLGVVTLAVAIAQFTHQIIVGRQKEKNDDSDTEKPRAKGSAPPSGNNPEGHDVTDTKEAGSE